MKDNHNEISQKNFDNLEYSDVKKDWIKPEIQIWNAENIELFGGKGGDGSAQAYAV
ncbi:hypothetical protein [Aquirufa salirivi]|uniref:Uncharacterized protein n=1 Tax=Aquirufa salirivi TaxID=3104729 RepID=A0ABW8RUZ9_9BACT